MRVDRILVNRGMSGRKSIQKIIKEDIETQREIQRKKEMNKKHMYEAYEDKERRKQEYLQNERNEREKE